MTAHRRYLALSSAGCAQSSCAHARLTGLPANRTAFSPKNALTRPRGGATSLLAAPRRFSASTGIVLSPVVPMPNHYNWFISRAIAHHPRQERSSRTKRGRHSAPNRTSDMPSLDKLCVRCSRARARTRTACAPLAGRSHRLHAQERTSGTKRRRYIAPDPTSEIST